MPNIGWLTTFHIMKSSNRKNRNGDRMQPCLTPVRRSNVLVVSVSVFTQQCELRFLNMLMFCCGLLYAPAIPVSDVWWILSKAFRKSMKFRDSSV